MQYTFLWVQVLYAETYLNENFPYEIIMEWCSFIFRNFFIEVCLKVSLMAVLQNYVDTQVSSYKWVNVTDDVRGI